LGGNPSISFILKKKKSVFLSPPLFSPRHYWFHPNLGLLYVFFIEDNKSLKHDGWAYSSLGESVDLGCGL